jgi:hypothetical protein
MRFILICFFAKDTRESILLKNKNVATESATNPQQNVALLCCHSTVGVWRSMCQPNVLYVLDYPVIIIIIRILTLVQVM